MGDIKCDCHIKEGAFEFGVNIRRKGFGIEYNPYTICTQDWHDFRDGWYEADKTTDDCENVRKNND